MNKYIEEIKRKFEEATNEEYYIWYEDGDSSVLAPNENVIFWLVKQLEQAENKYKTDLKAIKTLAEIPISDAEMKLRDIVKYIKKIES